MWVCNLTLTKKRSLRVINALEYRIKNIEGTTTFGNFNNLREHVGLLIYISNELNT